MNLTHINTDNLAPYLPHGLSHAVVAEGGKTVYLSGQLGWNEDGKIAGPDLADQLAQAHINIKKLLTIFHLCILKYTRIFFHFGFFISLSVSFSRHSHWPVD